MDALMVSDIKLISQYKAEYIAFLQNSRQEERVFTT